MYWKYEKEPVFCPNLAHVPVFWQPPLPPLHLMWSLYTCVLNWILCTAFGTWPLEPPTPTFFVPIEYFEKIGLAYFTYFCIPPTTVCWQLARYYCHCCTAVALTVRRAFQAVGETFLLEICHKAQAGASFSRRVEDWRHCGFCIFCGDTFGRYF